MKLALAVPDGSVPDEIVQTPAVPVTHGMRFDQVPCRNVPFTVALATPLPSPASTRTLTVALVQNQNRA